MKNLNRLWIFAFSLWGILLFNGQSVFAVDCPPRNAQEVKNTETISGMIPSGMGSNVNIGDDTRASSTRDTSLTSRQGEESDRGSPTDRVQSGQDIGSRFADREQRRDQEVGNRRAADAYTSYRTGVTTLPQGPITPSGGTTTTSIGGTPQTAGTTGSGTPSGGTTAIGQTTPGTKPPITTGGTTTPPITPTGGSGPTGTTTAGTSQSAGTQSSQPSTISIRADSGHIIQINFPNGEGKSVKQETLQSGKYTEKMNVIACPGVGSHVDAAVNISVSIGSDEFYLIYTISNIWDPTLRKLWVKRGVNIYGEPINEGDLKRITSEYKVYVSIYSKGEVIDSRQWLSTTYFCLQGTK